MEFALAEQGRKDMLGIFLHTVAEPKFDGERAFMVKANGQVSLINRRKTNITMKFPDVAKAGEGLPEGTILDGEITVMSREGTHNCPSTAWRANISQANVAAMAKRQPATFVAFDILYFNNEDMRSKPFKERRRSLQGLFGICLMDKPEGIMISPQIEDHHLAWQVWVEHEGSEGIMLKDLNEPYRGRRTSAWIKVKAWAEKDFKVVGFTSEAREVSALQLENGHDVNCPRINEGIIVKEALSTGKEVIASVRYLPPYRFPILAKVEVR